MNHHGIRRVSNDWFKSYLSNRNQYVSVNGFDSGLASINCGIPQGSVLGPPVFLLSINDLNQAIKFCKGSPLCWWYYRLQHMKNKGVRQSHTMSWNSEAIDVWKVARHPPSRWVVVCDDYSFQNTIAFFLLQWDVETVIKSKLKQASKDSRKSSTTKKYKQG